MPKFTDERIQEMLKGRRAVKTYPFPGLEDVEVGLRALTDNEIDDARMAAQRHVKERKADLDVDPFLFDRECQRQVLWRAVVDPESDPDEPEPFFPSFRDVRQLDGPIVQALWDAYEEHQEYVSPIRTLDPTQLREFIDALGKDKAPDVLLTGFAHDTLRRCVLSMASKLRETSPKSR